MRATRLLIATLLLCAACAGRRQPQPDDVSGFLDDYRMLRPGGQGDVALVYRDPDADWPSYGKVLFEPVTLWRSGRKSLDPVPEADLLRLISDLENAVRRRLGEGFQLVDHPEPGTMRIRLAITEARASDPVLDVLRGRSGGDAKPVTARSTRDAALHRARPHRGRDPRRRQRPPARGRRRPAARGRRAHRHMGRGRRRPRSLGGSSLHAARGPYAAALSVPPAYWWRQPDACREASPRSSRGDASVGDAPRPDPSCPERCSHARPRYMYWSPAIAVTTARHVEDDLLDRVGCTSAGPDERDEHDRHREQLEERRELARSRSGCTSIVCCVIMKSRK